MKAPYIGGSLMGLSISGICAYLVAIARQGKAGTKELMRQDVYEVAAMVSPLLDAVICYAGSVSAVDGNGNLSLSLPVIFAR